MTYPLPEIAALQPALQCAVCHNVLHCAGLHHHLLRDAEVREGRVVHHVGSVGECRCGAKGPAGAAVVGDVLIAVQRGVADAVHVADVVGRGQVGGAEGGAGQRGLHHCALRGKEKWGAGDESAKVAVTAIPLTPATIQAGASISKAGTVDAPEDTKALGSTHCVPHSSP